MKVQREQLETLPVAQLKEIAKANDIKGIASMKKAALIDAILQMSEGSTSRSYVSTVSREEAESPMLWSSSSVLFCRVPSSAIS